ncbi:MAG TPA: ester cyclase [Actinomycetota bacterium]|nr:ester cyclase [Actinomycetota bacterium]
MSEESKAVVRRLLELIDARDLDGLGAVVADDVVLHGEGDARGLESMVEHTREFVTGFPDLQTTVEDVIAEGDRVVVRATLRGTHSGEFGGIPPTGRPIEISDVDIFRVHEGRIVEVWAGPDRLGMMQQLGLLGEGEGEGE